ncbi:hypothetical protein ASD08_43845 [Streptomyces sp. Root369]|nr:hypothetical protein ASD08_43845 [Streptomyces sp. Root369]
MASLFPAPAPLHEDPVHAGSTEQVVQYDGPLWSAFFARGRADVDGSGVASANRSGWFARGVLDSLACEPGTDPFRAPEIVRAQKARGSLPLTTGTG